MTSIHAWQRACEQSARRSQQRRAEEKPERGEALIVAMVVLTALALSGALAHFPF